MLGFVIVVVMCVWYSFPLHSIEGLFCAVFLMMHECICGSPVSLVPNSIVYRLQVFWLVGIHI